ncbi:phage head completion protein [Streptomyces sp.]|uniref:phage head completion protein n=1 Tax=Streptomyces sp. TaxID=1931 RepID=UPI002F3F10B1
MTGSIGHLLNRTLEVWRELGEDDGYGGRRTVRSLAGQVPAKVDQPSAAERTLAQQSGSEHTHTVYLLPDADVARGDQLSGDGDTFRVLSTVTPSAPAYLKAECALIQAAPT